MVDRHNLPRPAPEVTEDGIPATSEIPEEVLLTGDPLEGELPPLDHPQAVTDWGTTAAEQLGEPLEVRLRREVPDAAPDDEDGGIEDSLSAEEAAMRVVEDPSGLNYDPDPGYLDRP